MALYPHRMQSISAKPLLAVLATLLLSSPLEADDVQPGVDGKGKISLTVNFLVPPLGGAPRYLAICESFADALWVASEGNHYLGSMRFVYGTYPGALIDWDYQTSGHSGTASFQSSLHMHENAGYSADSTADLLLHEFGHYFYGQNDEYQRVTWGSFGVCVEDDGTGNPDPDRIPCDDVDPMTNASADCAADQYCALGKRCTGDPSVLCSPNDVCADAMAGTCSGGTCSDDPGIDCDAAALDQFCAAGGNGVCVWPGSAGGPLDAPMGNALNGLSMCNDESETVAGEGTVSYTCNMANKVAYHRWCDSTRHLHDISVNSSTLDLELAAGYNCWDRAATNHPTDLGAFHTLGDPIAYSATGDLGPTAEPVDCIWAVDPLSADDHSVLLVDKSGSMAYVDFVGATAVDSAADGALYFYNQTPGGNHVGVYAYNTGTSTVEALAAKAGDLDGIALAAGGNTNIGQAIATAVQEFAAGNAPDENRNIVIFSDGKHNTGPEDPVDEAAAACAAGINVSTISYGDADSASLEQIAQAPGCSGFVWVTGTESPFAAAQNPHELKTTLARSRHHLLGRQEVLESRGPLSWAMSEEKRSFYVPAGSETLEVAWLGNRARLGSTLLYAFNSLDFELVSPGGTSFTPMANTPEQNGLYRALRIDRPEVGIWTLKVDTSAVVPENPDLEVAWLASVEHPTLRARAWAAQPRRAIGQPVTIRASLGAGGYLSTGLMVQARVTHAANTWSVALHDDGLHDDEEADDGIYGGIFDSAALPAVGPGGYRVKVSLAAFAGAARPARVESPDAAEPTGLPAVPPAVVEAETMFRLSRGTTQQPDGSTAVGTVVPQFSTLEQGGNHRDLVAEVSGLAAHEGNLRLGLGPGVAVTNVRVRCLSCADTAGERTVEVTFDAAVDPRAATGPRRLLAQVGFGVATSDQEVAIVEPPRR